MPYPPAGAMLQARELGATISRIVIDPGRPLARTYDAAIQLRRAAGLRVQLVVGGASTSLDHPSDLERVARATIRVFRRYPHAWSISMFNEPDLDHVPICRYARVFRHTYRTLKRLGARRVLLGEVMANTTTAWLRDWHRCRQPAGDGFAFHGYGFIRSLPGAPDQWPAVARLARSYHLSPYVTEFGVPTRGPWAQTPAAAAGEWRHALTMARRIRAAEIVVYNVSQAPASSAWDTSVVAADGQPREAFAAIRSAG